MKKTLLLLVSIAAFTLAVVADTVNLTWDPVPEATSYNVYSRVHQSGGVFNKVATVTEPAFATNHVTTGRWEYYVKPVNLAGEGPASVTLTTPAPPAAPTNFVMTVTSP